MISLEFLKILQYIYLMNWQDMYEVTLERVQQLNKELDLLRSILRSYLPVIERVNDEKR